MSFCGECGLGMASADTGMLRHWISTTGAVAGRWKGRLEAEATAVCPACDSYALGIEHMLGLPFHSQEVAAFLTVHDCDWWNRSEIDIRAWPDFGCMTFSEAAIDSAIAYVREPTRGPLQLEPPAFEPALLGPSGIPEDQHAELEWHTQLDVLHARMGGKYSRRELDLAVRALLRVVA